MALDVLIWERSTFPLTKRESVIKLNEGLRGQDDRCLRRRNFYQIKYTLEVVPAHIVLSMEPKQHRLTEVHEGVII